MVRKYFIELAAVITLLLNGIIYPATAIITHVDYPTDTVVVETASGFTYSFEGIEDLVEGDVMSLLMYNNGTPWSIADDEIISARYSGFVANNFDNPTARSIVEGGK